MINENPQTSTFLIEISSPDAHDTLRLLSRKEYSAAIQLYADMAYVAKNCPNGDRIVADIERLLHRKEREMESKFPYLEDFNFYFWRVVKRYDASSDGGQMFDRKYDSYTPFVQGRMLEIVPKRELIEGLLKRKETHTFCDNHQ